MTILNLQPIRNILKLQVILTAGIAVACGCCYTSLFHFFYPPIYESTENINIIIAASNNPAFKFFDNFNLEAMLSAVLGGIIGIVPGLLFALLFFKKSGAQALKQVMWFFYLGEAVKLLSCLLLFTLAFQWGKLKPAPMLIVYASTMLAYWVAPLMNLLKFIDARGKCGG